VISFIEGALSECGIFHSVVDVNGIGYFVNMPLTVSSKMPAIGNKVKLYTYIVYREDKQDMYGFLSKEERDFFKLVVEKVSGVGPKTTLNLMSKLSLSIIKNAIESRDLDILAKCHGIGKKSAERIIMELSDKNLHNE
jgi:Holliday junction DNA helicase RuvA